MADPDVLVDSSIWIEGLSPQAIGPLRTALRSLIEANRVVVTEMVRLEVIAGARSLEEFKGFRSDFEALRCLATTPREWLRAEELTFILHRRGLHVPATDLLIAAVALGHRIPLWHADRDFERIRQVMPELKTHWHPRHTPAL